MPPTKSSLVHQEVILLRASPEQVKAFILTPERIQDYYPSSIDCGVIDPGRSFYCRGKSGVSLLELHASESNEDKYVIKVTTALKVKSPFTAQKIRDAAFFTMLEDWEVEPHKLGSKLTKTWRDVKQQKLKFVPIHLIVKRSAKMESGKLKLAWDKAAQPQHVGNTKKA
ncbi:MAG: hypothetical protein O6945_06695 [Gammaproteobacteria bacterium]|nr:hypothetical protein [Gammaproteobacteria bacterium]